MPTAFKIVRDTPVNWAPPGGGVTWDAYEYAEDTTALGISSGNGVIGFTVGQSATYTVHLGRGESIGTLDGGIWTPVLATSSTVALTAGTQYYGQGAIGAARQAKIMLGYRLVASSSSSSDVTQKVYVRGLDINGVDLREELTLDGTSQVSSALYLAEVVSLSKDVTTGSVTIADAQGYSFRMSPKQTQSRFTRVEFDTTPTESKNMTIVFKKRVRDLVNDGDTPQISGIDEALMALALGDLYTKHRQLAKAAVKIEEGVNLLEVVRNRESVQQAQSIELIPSDLGGYTRDDFGW